MKRNNSKLVFFVSTLIVVLITAFYKTIAESVPSFKKLLQSLGLLPDEEIATVAQVVFASSSGGGSGSTPVNNTTLPSFTFQDAYLVGSAYVPYPTLVEAMDKNFEDSGFTNRNATLYATAMISGNVAYTDANSTTIYPEGRYFYGTNFQYLYINPQGVMSLFADIPKDVNSLLSFSIKESSN